MFDIASQFFEDREVRARFEASTQPFETARDNCRLVWAPRAVQTASFSSLQLVPIPSPERRAGDAEPEADILSLRATIGLASGISVAPMSSCCRSRQEAGLF